MSGFNNEFFAQEKAGNPFTNGQFQAQFEQANGYDQTQARQFDPNRSNIGHQAAQGYHNQQVKAILL